MGSALKDLCRSFHCYRLFISLISQAKNPCFIYFSSLLALQGNYFGRAGVLRLLARQIHQRIEISDKIPCKFADQQGSLHRDRISPDCNTHHPFEKGIPKSNAKVPSRWEGLWVLFGTLWAFNFTPQAILLAFQW